MYDYFLKTIPMIYMKFAPKSASIFLDLEKISLSFLLNSSAILFLSKLSSNNRLFIETGPLRI